MSFPRRALENNFLSDLKTKTKTKTKCFFFKMNENTISPFVFVFVFVLRSDKKFGSEGPLGNDMKKAYKHIILFQDL